MDDENVIAECCGVQLELWIPPTVRCKKCKAIYNWGTVVQCMSGPNTFTILQVDASDRPIRRAENTTEA